MKFETIKKVTVTEQIMERIAELIMSGELPSGQKLPNERSLAEQFGVTRGRIREALRALALVGLVTIKAGDGTYVTKREQPLPAETITYLFHNELHNLDEIYEARRLIESAIYLSAAKHINAEQIEHLKQMLDSLTVSASDPDFTPETFMQLLDQFDLYAGDNCGNGIYAKLMQTIVYLRRESNIKLLQVPGAVQNSVETRSIMLQALQEGDENKVKDALDLFFTRAKQFYNNILHGAE
ncbi:hypothetical protein SD70_06215 [Gordoniibacillus kamchatkensis]|uniref:HTH gntR-type domain-containing protein n=1 Tax=Gordoniibacillus kamchatkensis TaxID=1590651 RepID=A0ABR5AKF4_9BACL|nr:GntR family transcriptional regulator [Paenibacillus sp. VKM B-2647]KIL41484.1 hypothetical protein SD70_06215 [Paenibacillus sp. VKM B-2647]